MGGLVWQSTKEVKYMTETLPLRPRDIPLIVEDWVAEVEELARNGHPNGEAEELLRQARSLLTDPFVQEPLPIEGS